ncbi:MAG: glycosyltransferase [Chthoniobacterales bacterium]
MRFTIVTPSYNQLDWLRLCIASVRDQMATKAETGNLSLSERQAKAAAEISIEHVVQDAGTPGIEEFAREMGAGFYQDGKKVFSAQHSVGGQLSDAYSLAIYLEKDVGMYDAINKGLRKASGDICAYLNCDEQYLPGTLRWVADYFLNSPKVEVLFGAAIVTRGDGSYVCDRRVMVPTRWHTLVSGNLSIFTSSTFFRRKSVVERGLLFDPQWRVCGDAVWALQFLKAGLRMEATHRSLSAFAETGVNMSAADNPHAAQEARRLAISAPLVARALKPVVLLDYRLRRWWSGAYALKAHSYAVYAEGDTRHRKRFDVAAPSFRWKMGVGAT